MDEHELTWRKSSRSGTTGGDCVEVAVLPHRVMIRDSKDPLSATLTLNATEWRAFLATFRRSEPTV
jgi:predicted secreted Zn-dependent protease